MTKHPGFDRVEVSAVAAGVSSSTVRMRAGRGDVPAIRCGKTLLVDTAALVAIYAPRPAAPVVVKATK